MVGAIESIIFGDYSLALFLTFGFSVVPFAAEVSDIVGNSRYQDYSTLVKVNTFPRRIWVQWYSWIDLPVSVLWCVIGIEGCVVEGNGQLSKAREAPEPLAKNISPMRSRVNYQNSHKLAHHFEHFEKRRTCEFELDQGERAHLRVD